MTTPTWNGSAATAGGAVDASATAAEASGGVIETPAEPPVAGGDAGAAPAAESGEGGDKPLPAFVDARRNAIYEKFARNRGAMDASESAMADGVRALAAGTERIGGDANTPGQGLADPSDVRTIVVDGQPRTVPRAEVEQAGVRALQKEHSADQRLQRATILERELGTALQNLPAEVERRAAEIAQRMVSEGRLPTGGAPTSGATGKSGLPSGGDSGTGTVQATKQALEALLDSDTDRAAETLERVIAERAERIVADRLNTGAATGAARAPGAPGRTEAEIAAANDVFAMQYQDILADPVLQPIATSRMLAAMNDPARQGVPLHRIALQIGTELRTQLQQPVGGAPPNAGSGSASELEARRRLAARVPAVPIRAGARPADTPAPAPQTIAESRRQAVINMRRARGLPV